MRKMLRAMALAMLMLGIAVPAFAQAKISEYSPEELRQAAEEIAKKYDAAYNKKDVAALLDLYARDPVFVPPGPVVEGKPALQLFYKSRFDAGATGHVTRVIDVRPVGKGAFGVAEWSVMVPGPNGAMKEIHGNLLAVYQHQVNGWKMLSLTANIIPAASN